MHELSIAENIIEIVKQNAAVVNASRVNCVKIRIGELAGVVPDSLDFCYSAIIAGTELEGSRLEIEKTDIVIHCPACGVDSKVEDLFFICPECGGSDTKMISGDELWIVGIDFDE